MFVVSVDIQKNGLSTEIGAARVDSIEQFMEEM